jgi:ABC-type Fe3+-hydroxamate transport system substrate-binding protein
VQRFVLASIVVLVALLVSCSRATPPEQVDDGPRIAVLSPAVADLLADLGLSDRIVARHAFDRFSEQTLPVVGDQSGVDYERLLRVRPTHVLLEWGAPEPPARLASLAADRGWVVHDFPLLTLSDIRDATAVLGELFAAHEVASELLAQMDAAWAVHDGLDVSAGRTLPLYWTNPVGVAGPGSFHHQLLEVIGVTLAITEGNPYITLDPADLLRLDPDTIVLFAPGVDVSALDDALAPLDDLHLRAVDSGRVVLINHPKCLTPSAAMIDVANQTAEALAALGPVESSD